MGAKLHELLRGAGVRVGGDAPWDPRVHDARLWRRVALRGPTGLGDAYVDGWWDCDALDEFFDRCLRAGLSGAFARCPAVRLETLRRRVLDRQRPRAARRNVERHYELGDELFAAMLDRRMVYSCGYWEHAADLEGAQEAKLDLVCRKLGIAPGMSLLDIGCGWGGLARHAAERYGARVVGITLSGAQVRHAKGACEGLAVEIRLQDYRDVRERFDRIASIGMFEHVGVRHHREFMRVVRRSLAEDGLCLLHFFATQRGWPSAHNSEALWVERHIFPGMAVPSLAQVGAAMEGLMVLEDLHNFGADYDPTLMAWWVNFDRAWPALRDRYGERFYRMWRYYLHLCAAAFRSRKYQVWQLALSPSGVRGGYRVRGDRYARGTRAAESPIVAVQSGRVRTGSGSR